MAEAGFDAPAQLPEEAGIPDVIIKHEMNGDDTASEIVADDPLSSTLNENGDGVRDGLGFLYEDDSSEDEATVTIGAIQKNVPFQKGSMASKDKIDMDGQPTINGTMIYDLDLATMEDKPWQKPGADITDYFNYGFNEETWNSYCERQRKLRAEYGTQKEVNRAITSSININFNPQQSQQQPILSVMNQGGRQLINLAGPEKPTKANKVFDLTKPPPSMVEPVSPQIQVLGSNRNVSEVNEESSSPTSTVPVFNAFVPPPNFNPNVPPPGMSRASTLPSVNLNIPPPAFNQQAPIYAFAGFNNNQPPPQKQFSGHNSSGPQPLLGTDFSSNSFEKHNSRERTQGESSENSGDEHSRRRRRRRSGDSPRRRKEEKPRDYRDKSSSSRSRRRDDHREKRRDREDDYEKDRKRRKHDRSDRTSGSSKKYEREESPEAPPGFD